MKTLTHAHPNAAWRPVASRLRSRVNSCPIVISDASGMEPSVAIFATDLPTRRGAP